MYHKPSLDRLITMARAAVKQTQGPRRAGHPTLASDKVVLVAVLGRPWWRRSVLDALEPLVPHAVCTRCSRTPMDEIPARYNSRVGKAIGKARTTPSNYKTPIVLTNWSAADVVQATPRSSWTTYDEFEFSMTFPGDVQATVYVLPPLDTRTPADPYRAHEGLMAARVARAPGTFAAWAVEDFASRQSTQYVLAAERVVRLDEDSLADTHMAALRAALKLREFGYLEETA